jgi:hypothetical protein
MAVRLFAKERRYFTWKVHREEEPYVLGVIL